MRSSEPSVEAGALRRYRDAFWSSADRLSATEDWALLLPWTVALGVVLVAGIRLLQWWSLGSGHAALRWLGVVPGVAVAAACIALLLWSYWRSTSHPDTTGAYLVVLLAGATTILVCAEAFAGVTALIAGSVGGDDLWAAEQRYLWELAGAVPFVEAPETVGWPEPHGLAGAQVGGLILVFKILVIVPLLQVSVAGYRAVQRHRFAAGERPTAGQTWAHFGALLVMTGLAAAALVLLVDRTSFVNRWADERLGEGVSLLGVHVPLSWIQVAVDCVVAWALLWLLSSLLSEIEWDAFVHAESLRAAAGALGFYAATGPLLVVAAAAASLALLHMGVAAVEPTPAPGDEIGAAVGWYAWHLAAMIPFLDLPQSLDWSLRYELVDHWSGAVLLGAKVALFGLLLVPVGWLVRTAAQRLRPPASGQVTAARELAERLAQLDAELDDVEARILADEDGVFPALDAARAALRALEPARERVRALFGEGPVTDAADAAVTAAGARLEAAAANAWTRWDREQIRRRLEPTQREAARRAAEFETLAAAALREAAPARRPRGRSGTPQRS